MADKIRPNATVEWDDGNDGKDGHYYIDFTCPKCKARLWSETNVCPTCKIPLDWSKKAKIKITYTVEWE